MRTNLRTGLARAALALSLPGGIAALITATAAPALADYPVLTTPLTGPAIGGVTPPGRPRSTSAISPSSSGRSPCRCSR